MPRPRYSKEEFARRGDELYEQCVVPHLVDADKGKFVVIDIESGDYEIDSNEAVASDRLWTRFPDAQPWVVKVGSRHVWRFGAASRQVPA